MLPVLAHSHTSGPGRPAAALARPNKIGIYGCGTLNSNMPNHAMIQTLELKKSFTLPDFIKAAAVKAVLTHVLFSRGAIPCPAEHLLKKVQHQDVSGLATPISSDKRMDVYGVKEEMSEGEKLNQVESSVSGRTAATITRNIPLRRKRGDIIRDRKYEKHGLQIQSVLHDIQTIFGVTIDDNKEAMVDANANINTNRRGHVDSNSCHRNFRTMEESSGIKAVLITLGPSFHSPREQYILRFHSWQTKTSECNKRDESLSPSQIPLSKRKKLEQEIGLRCVRELINGSLEEEHYTMFEARGGGVNGQNASIKVNIACLMQADAVEALLNPQSDSPLITGMIPSSESDDSIENSTGAPPFNGISKTMTDVHAAPSAYTHPTPFQPFTSHSLSSGRPRFTIQRNLEVKQPRMFSKSRGIHRPFAVLDIIPSMKPPPHEKSCNSEQNESGDDTSDTCITHNLNENDMDISVDMENGSDGDFQGPGCIHEDGDTWIALKSFVKGFRA